MLAVESAGGLVESEYTAESWTVVADALVAAEAVLVDPDATQGEVDAAKVVLTDAVAALVRAPVVDKAGLVLAVESAGGLVESEYTAESWTVVADALAAAEAVLADKDATQAEVDAAKVVLTDAVAALVKAPVVDKTGLESAVESAGGLVESEYTAESWTVVADALAAAEAVLA
ncbi:MAG: FIVAR domain-containing protein, partial [Propionibacteriaceae bacterium]|nr:FIVAR domain-containing protein [Propionibacteriaceae bacterium]